MRGTRVSTEYRPHIDGLRAVAVIGVLVYHARFEIGGGLLFPGGYLGVDVFFVISGFLISLIILRETSAGTFSFGSFFGRRIRRILPILLVVMLATLAVGWFLLLPEPFTELASSALAALGFGSNIWFWLEDGYTAEPSQFKPLLHTWSLAVEEQFYLVFPFLFVMLLRLRRATAVWIIVGLAVLSLGVAQDTSHTAPEFAFFFALTRAWELLAGTLVAMAVFHDRLPQWQVAKRWFALIGLVVIFGSFLWFDTETRHPSILTLLPVCATCLVLAYGDFKGFAHSVLSWRPAVYLGLISYSLYLWHWPVFVYFRGLGLETLIPIGLLLSVGLSVLSFHWIERPFRRTLSLPRFNLWVGSGLATVVSTCCVILVAQGIPSRLSYDLADSKRDGFEWDGLRCHHHDRCIVNWEAEGPKFVLVGDSHAGALSGPLGRYLTEQGYGYAQFTSSACLHVPGVRVIARDDRFHRDCMARAAELDAFLEASPTATILHFGYYTQWLTSTRARNYKGRLGASALAALEHDVTVADALAQTFAEWSDKGRKIVFVAPAPELLFNPFASFTKTGFVREQEPSLASRSVHEALTAPYREILRPFLEADSVRIFDPADAFCPDDLCLYRTDTGILYTDFDHLSGKGASLLTEAMIREGVLPAPR